ncbi:MAG: DUF2849 domain-containing protein [Methylocystaceae bacterium]|nr:DUF2849 domain-containing protein [Methylocystaceae bacterium]
MTKQVITANRLDDGLAVFYGLDGQWHSSVSQAACVEKGEAAENLLANASNEENQLVVVGPYLIDVCGETGTLEPVRYRELIRTKGPSVRPDLGYQSN